MGNLYLRKSRNVYDFEVKKYSDILKLIEFFDTFPLQTNKKEDYLK
jgi:hypothetical protein